MESYDTFSDITFFEGEGSEHHQGVKWNYLESCCLNKHRCRMNTAFVPKILYCQCARIVLYCNCNALLTINVFNLCTAIFTVHIYYGNVISEIEQLSTLWLDMYFDVNLKIELYSVNIMSKLNMAD